MRPFDCAYFTKGHGWDMMGLRGDCTLVTRFFSGILILLAMLLTACVAPTPTAVPDLAPAIPAPLVNTQWTVTMLSGNPPAASDAGAPLTLQFGGKDTVIGSGGCTSFRGPVAGDDARLVLGPLSAGTASCGEAVDRQEQSYLQALQAVTSYALDGDDLILFDTAGQELVRARRTD